jgi:hypothetical protein
MDRTCGTCFACCVALGITELKKWPSQTCRHLTPGDSPELDHRCSIYQDRPAACQIYRCGWLQGLGEEDGRPDQSGQLVSTYLREDEVGIAATIMVTDPQRAGSALEEGSRLHGMISHLLELGITELRITQDGRALYFRDGTIKKGRILHPGKGKYEGMLLEVEDEPLGHYELREDVKKD